MSRLVLIPFHTTPSDLQLDGPARDTADLNVDHAMQEACKSVINFLGIGDTIQETFEDEFPGIIARVRQVIPEANTRIHRSYAWLMFATLKVCMHKLLL